MNFNLNSFRPSFISKIESDEKTCTIKLQKGIEAMTTNEIMTTYVCNTVNEIWNLDLIDYDKEKVNAYMIKHNLLNDSNSRYKIGDTIEFWTGYNDDIRARATIKGISGDDLYVYNDCYWFPIQDDEKRDIKLI